MLRNIDERKKIEEELRESRAKFQSIFELSPQAIYLSELRTGTIREVNRRFCEISEYSKDEVIGKNSFELGFCAAEKLEYVKDLLQKKGEVQGLEAEFKTKSGAIKNALVFSKVINIDREDLILSIVVDLTEQKRLEAMLRHAQKMEAVGTLAGGIAHDFNNLLQGLSGFTQVLLMGKEPSHLEYRHLKAIEEVIQRGADLTSRLLLYARRVKSNLEPLQINQQVMEVKKILDRAVPKMISVDLDLDADLRYIEGDRAEFEQVLMNLCLNAKDAMPEGGKITIETRNVVLDRQFCKDNPGAKEGEYVLIRVSDTGHGIDEGLLDHIFEPFFTTKGTGKGTGLGLAMVYSIVKAHRGYITCTSKVNEGTTFDIYLPASTGRGGLRVEEDLSDVNSQKFGTKVLLVDDEEMILQTTKSILEHYGLEVITAESGEEALEVFRSRGDEIDLVMLDLGMPGMGGKMCLRELRKISSEVKVVIASGYGPGEQDDQLSSLGVSGFIGKPYKCEQLIESINRALGKS